METTNINILIKPILDGNNTIPFLTTKEFEASIKVDSNTLLKDICRVVLEEYGLELLSHTSEAYIKTSDSKCINCKTFYPNKEINIDIVQNLIGGPFTIVVFVHSKIENFCEAGMKSISQKFLPNNNHFAKDCPEKTPIQRPLDSNMLQSDERLIKMTKLLNSIPQFSPFCLLENKQNTNISKFSTSTELSIGNKTGPDNNQKLSTKCKIGILKKPEQISINYTPTPTRNNATPMLGVQLSLDNYFKKKQAILRTPLSRWSQCKTSKLKLDQPKEMFLLKQFYQRNKYPSNKEITQYTKKINLITKRSGSSKITPYQVLTWFQERSKQEKMISCADPNITL